MKKMVRIARHSINVQCDANELNTELKENHDFQKAVGSMFI